MRYAVITALAALLLGACTPAEEPVEETTPPAEEESMDEAMEIDEDAPFQVGDAVYAEYESNNWFRATVDGACEDDGFQVTYYDNKEKCHAADELIADVALTEEDVEVGTKVIADWAGGSYYDAEVTAIADGVYSVEYYDGFTKDLSLSDMRLDPR